MIRSPACEPPRPGCPWPLRRTRVPVSRARRHGDGHRALGTHLSRAVAGRARLRGDLSPAAALGTGTVHREAALTERDRAAPIALVAGLDLGPGRATAAVAGGAGIGHRHRHGDLAAEHRGAERHLEHRLDGLALLLLAPTAAEDGREDVAQPTEAAHVAEIDFLLVRTGRRAHACPAAARPDGARAYRMRRAGASGRTASASRDRKACRAPRRSA